MEGVGGRPAVLGDVHEVEQDGRTDAVAICGAIFVLVRDGTHREGAHSSAGEGAAAGRVLTVGLRRKGHSRSGQASRAARMARLRGTSEREPCR